MEDAKTGKEFMESVWKFSDKAVQMAEQDGLTIRELYRAADMIKEMAGERTPVKYGH